MQEGRFYAALADLPVESAKQTEVLLTFVFSDYGANIQSLVLFQA
jgi:hypothetical protein